MLPGAGAPSRRRIDPAEAAILVKAVGLVADGSGSVVVAAGVYGVIHHIVGHYGPTGAKGRVEVP